MEQERESLAVLARRAADGRRVMTRFFKTNGGTACCLDLMGIMRDPSAAELGYARIIADNMSRTLARSEIYLADADMCSLLDAAAPGMPDQVLREDDPIAPDGFVTFAVPVPDRTGTGLVLDLHAMSWAYLPDGHRLLVERGTGPSVLITSFVSSHDVAGTLGGPRGGVRMLAPGAPRFVANASVVWEIGKEIGTAYGEVPEIEGVNPGFYQRLMAAFWTLSKQPLTETQDAERLSRKDRDRMRAAAIERPDEPVRIVRLRRRPTGPDRDESRAPGEDSGRRIGVRFINSGYWRNTWYPSIEDHRVQWIPPHLKGPEGGPFKGGEKVFLASGGDLRGKVTGSGPGKSGGSAGSGKSH